MTRALEVCRGTAGNIASMLQDVLRYYVTRQIGQWKRAKADLNQAFNTFFVNFMKFNAKQLHLNPNDLKWQNVNDFKDWYCKNQKTELKIPSAPPPRGGISTSTSSIRHGSRPMAGQAAMLRSILRSPPSIASYCGGQVACYGEWASCGECARCSFSCMIK